MGLINPTECPNSFFYYAFSIMYQIHHRKSIIKKRIGTFGQINQHHFMSFGSALNNT